MFSLRLALLIIPCLLFPSPLGMPQGVTEIIQPEGTSPQGCIDSYPGIFGFKAVDHPMLADIQCILPRTLQMSVQNGIMVDHLGRIGSIVSNRQLQFDGPPAQAGAIYTGGWSLCPENLIALGPQKQFYACSSGYCKPPENFKQKGALGILTCVQLRKSTTG